MKKHAFMTSLCAIALTGSALCGCTAAQEQPKEDSAESTNLQLSDRPQEESAHYQADQEAKRKAEEEAAKAKAEEEARKKAEEEAAAKIDVSNLGDHNPANEDGVRKALAGLDFTQSFKKDLVQGEKPAKYQKYIVLHDTEGDGNPADVYDFWLSDGTYRAAHFVIGKDGSVMQGIPLNKICHHAGFGDTGHNKKYGVTDESRDAKQGTKEVGSWASDYGMNSYSVGIEMIHIGGKGKYPKAQLEALDKVIAYIDAYFGFDSTIIDHKMWRTGNSDTSKEFKAYLKNYRDHRSYK